MIKTFKHHHLVDTWRNIGTENLKIPRSPLIFDKLSKLKHMPDCEYLHPYNEIGFARSFQIFDIFKDTHYIFHHAKCGKVFLPFTILINSIMNKRSSETFSPYETYLRHPIQLKGIHRNVNYYTNNIQYDNLDIHNDSIYTTELISADAHLLSTEFAESAYRFYVTNGGHSLNILELKRLAVENIATLSNNQNSFIRDFSEVEDQIYNMEGTGILFTICVEKSYFSTCGYLSRPFGVHYKVENIPDTLEQLQHCNISNENTPQVRLLAHKLDPQYVKIFMFPGICDTSYIHAIDLVHYICVKYFKS